MAPSAKVLLTAGLLHYDVQGLDKKTLAACLSVTEQSAELREDGKIHYTAEPLRCWRREGGRLLLLPGEADRLANHLRLQGRNCEFHGSVTNELQEIILEERLALRRQAGAADLEGAEEFLSSPTRAVLANTGAEQVTIIRNLARVYAADLPEDRISTLVVARNAEARRWLHRQLRAEFGERIVADGDFDHMWSRRDRIVVVPPSVFELVNPDDWDAYAFVGPEAVLSEFGYQKLRHLVSDRTRRYPPVTILLHDGRRLGPADQLRLESIFGVLTAEGSGPEVIMVRCRTRTAEAVNAANWRRELIWENRARNELIVRIARGLASRDPEMFQKLGLALHPEAAVPTVAVVVDLPVHGRELETQLPWPLLTTIPDEDGICQEDPGPIALPHIIVTEAALYESLGRDVYVNASAGDVRWGLGTDGDKVRTAVVDLLDAGTRRLRGRAAQIMQGYEQCGWRVRRATVD